VTRPAVGADRDAVADLERTCFGPDAWSASVVEAELAHPDRVVLVHESQGQVVAWVDLGVVADVADLHRVAVAPERRRGGLAGTLLRSGLDAVAARGAERVLLEVAADNDAAVALYAAHGFTPIARRRGYYAGGRDAVVMELPLGPRP
jgi:ribosomal-protein-alanine acetyltransferase